MRRKLIPFLCVLLGCYVGLGLLLRGLTAHERHANDLEHQTSPLFSPNDPPLLVAVVQGNSAEIARLLQTGTDLDRADRAGRIPRP